jgi:hypothetical protein
MTTERYIEENNRRRAALYPAYNPISGYGDTVGTRDELLFTHNNKKVNWNIPAAMFDEPIIQRLIKYKSTQKAADAFDAAPSAIFNLLMRARCKHDHEFWAASCAKIQDKETKKILPFILNKPQRKLQAAIEKQREAGDPVRIIICKARQWGGSTNVQLDMFRTQTVCRERWHSVIATDVENQARIIRSMTTRVAKNHPPEITPITIKNFEGSAKNKHIIQTDTVMSIGSMQQPDNLRSQDIMMAHLCIHPNTEIPVKDGFSKCAKELCTEDTITTHTGATAQVSAVTKSKPSKINGNGKAIILKPWGQQPVILTPNHPIFTQRGWVNAENISKDDFVTYPIRKITHNIKSIKLPTFYQRAQGGGSIPKGSGMNIELNKEIGFAFGYYLAEGNIHITHGKLKGELTYSSHDKEVCYALRAVKALSVISDKYTVVKIKNKKLTNTKFYDAALCKYIYDNFKSKEYKTVPDWFFDCGTDFLQGVLMGYLSGDGSKSNNIQGKYELAGISATTISSSIAFQIRDIAASLGLGFASIDIKKQGVHFGRNCKKAYILRWAGSSARKVRTLLGWSVPQNGHPYSEKSKIDNGFVWIKIKDIKTTTVEEVVDIEVNHSDHSFRTMSFSVKNSEVGLWKETEGKKPEDLIQTIVGSIPSIPGTMIVKESTAKGVGNYFHQAWQEAVSGRSNDVPVFVAWYEIAMYQKEITGSVQEFVESFTDYDKFLWQSGATLEGINWYRNKLKEFKGDTWRMQSEFPTTPEEAFNSSARRYFAPIYVKTAEQYVTPPLYIGELAAKARTGPDALHDIRFAPQPAGNLKIWIPPSSSSPSLGEGWREVSPSLGGGRGEVINRFCGFLDPAKGHSNSADFGVLTIIDRLPMLEGNPCELAARWRGRLDQDIVAWVSAMICKWYDNALLAIEINAMHHKLEEDQSHTILDEIAGHYDNLFFRQSVDDIQQKRPRKYGFHTNAANKNMILSSLNEALRDTTYIERDREAIDEYNCFEEKPNGTTGAVEGAHDDIVISTAGAVWLATSYMEPVKIITPRKPYIRNVYNEATF